jgi:two-component system cell cycle sensor histidine kinase/response regulator CckA
MDKKAQPLRILLVEDNPNDAELVLRELRCAGFKPDWHRVETEAEFSSSLGPELDIILSDYAMPQFSGLRALEALNKSGLEIPFIIVSGTIGEETAVAAMRSGAADYLLKDRLGRLGQAVQQALDKKRLRDERRQADERLREQTQIINQARDAIIIRNFADQRITFWNFGAEALYGWSANEAIGRQLGELILADPGEVQTNAEIISSTGEFHGEVKQHTKEGKELIVQVRASLIRNPDGTPRSVLIMNTDVTEQKKLEMQLLRAQRLESIGTLASGVAHDLNNILAPIMMGAAVLRRTEMPIEDQALLSTMEACAQRGADVVKQVLAFARGVEGERVAINPPHLVEEIIDVAKQTFPKSVQVSGRYPEDLWPIEGDPTQLHQVLLNLFVNARDAMPAGGMLTISGENFPVDEHYASMTPGAKAGPYVLFTVHDTGMGISPQNIERIFDPFFTTKELGQGTGLGLSTVIGIVKSHGGFMSVYSEIGRGTTFKVYLPALMGAVGALQESETAALPRANGELLLIVDDERSILQVAQALLEDHGYQVLTAVDATEALAIFAVRKDEIKLVLTDLAMPLMDGIALIRTLQKMKPDVRIVASTGQGGREQHAHELESLNVGACLTKPYNKNKLLKTLHDALNHQANHSNPPPQIHAPQ